MKFAQGIRIRCDDADALVDLLVDWDEGQATTEVMGYIGTRLLADRDDPGHYLILAEVAEVDGEPEWIHFDELYRTGHHRRPTGPVELPGTKPVAGSDLTGSSPTTRLDQRGARRNVTMSRPQRPTSISWRSPSKAYAASKLANILLTIELDRRHRSDGVTARALHPGVVETNFGKGADSPRMMGWLMTVLKPVLRSPEKGAATSVLLATADASVLDRGLYWSDQNSKEASPAALDAGAAARLWDIRAQLTSALPEETAMSTDPIRQSRTRVLRPTGSARTRTRKAG